MLILTSFPPKSSCCANDKFIDFEMALRGKASSPVEAMGNFARGIFFWWLESDKECFWPFESFIKLKEQDSVHIELKLKSQLAWPVCTKSIKLKRKVQQPWPQLKMNILLGHNIEIVMQWEGIKIFLGRVYWCWNFSWWEGN